MNGLLCAFFALALQVCISAKDFHIGKLRLTLARGGSWLDSLLSLDLFSL